MKVSVAARIACVCTSSNFGRPYKRSWLFSTVLTKEENAYLLYMADRGFPH